MNRFGALAFGFATSRSTSVAQTTVKVESPHAEAIALVIERQQTQIAQAEQRYFKENGVDWWHGDLEQYRWHDTITRSWSATRPFAPGIIDSTHWFDVVYYINGKVVSSRIVDTRKKNIELNKINAQNNERLDK